MAASITSIKASADSSDSPDEIKVVLVLSIDYYNAESKVVPNSSYSFMVSLATYNPTSVFGFSFQFSSFCFSPYNSYACFASIPPAKAALRAFLFANLIASSSERP